MHRLVSLVPLGLATVFLVTALTSLPLGQVTNPGPALWPVMVCVTMIALALILAVTERDAGDYEPFTPRARLVVLGAASVSGFVWAFTFIGITVPGFALLVVWIRYFGRESWPLTLAVSVLTTIAFYLIFVVLLAVPIPDDLLL